MRTVGVEPTRAYRCRVAAFECEVLRSVGHDHGKVAEMPLTKLARQSDALNGLPFVIRRRAVIDVADRLAHELDNMKIPHGDVMLEADARTKFLTAIHQKFAADLLGRDRALADQLEVLSDHDSKEALPDPWATGGADTWKHTASYSQMHFNSNDCTLHLEKERNRYILNYSDGEFL